MSFPIVAKRFSPAEFTAYVADVTLGDFKPRFVVVHNTSTPTLAMRPNGFTAQHMENIRSGYINDNHWSSGPHLFLDDKGIWVFTPLDQQGTHSPSWNKTAWGVEMLGEYDFESFTMGRGAQVASYAVQAVATLCRKIGVDSDTIRFHKEDTATTHKNCPGKNVVKADFVRRVAAILQTAPTPTPAPDPGWTILAPDGKTLRSGVPTGDLGTGLVRVAVEAIGGSVMPDGASRTIKLVKAVQG